MNPRPQIFGDVTANIPDFSAYGHFPWNFPSYVGQPQVWPSDLPTSYRQQQFIPINLFSQWMHSLQEAIHPFNVQDQIENIGHQYLNDVSKAQPFTGGTPNNYPFITAGFKQRMDDLRQSSNVYDQRPLPPVPEIFEIPSMEMYQQYPDIFNPSPDEQMYPSFFMPR